MLLSLVVCFFLVVLTVFIHYEVLRLVYALLPLLRMPLRMRILLVVLGCFFAHTIEVWSYAIVYFGLAGFGHGTLAGNVGPTSFSEFLYFSITSYSTLGFGDVYPTDGLRLIAGVEALNGLFLVAWSTSFTYLAMERLWPLHVRRKKTGAFKPHAPASPDPAPDHVGD